MYISGARMHAIRTTNLITKAVVQLSVCEGDLSWIWK